jgi:hypothetical protein
MISTTPGLLHEKGEGGRSKSVAENESPLKQRSFVFVDFLFFYHASDRVKKKGRENARPYQTMSISYVSIVITLCKMMPRLQLGKTNSSMCTTRKRERWHSKAR